MSNRIDFFQPARQDIATGSILPAVYLDGCICDFLVAERITLSAEPDFNEAILRYLPPGPSLQEAAEHIECGQRVSLKIVYDSGTGRALPAELTVFAGFIEQINTDMDENGQNITVIAKDFSSRLKRITVFGRNVHSAGQTVYLAGLDTTFNPQNRPNASKQLIWQNGRKYRIFSADEQDSAYFDCADAIYYLLAGFIPAGELVLPDISQLKELCGNCRIADLDVTGLNLIDALVRCCSQAGLRFKFVPTTDESAIEQAIVFFRHTTGREIEINCQLPGERIDLTRTNLAAVSIRKDFSPVTHRYSIFGDYKTYEATFGLVKGWDSSLESDERDRYSALTNENFDEVKDVWRKWVLNEAGDYSASPYNQGEPFDFSGIFEGSRFVQRHRRFLPAITADKDGASIGYYLQVSYTGGSDWQEYIGSFKVLSDRCGIWLSDEQLDDSLWQAAIEGLLKFRITASVAADERIGFVCADGPVNSIVPVVDKPVFLPQKFKYQKISPYSIFAHSVDENISRANQRDDTDLLAEYAQNLCRLSEYSSSQLQIKTLVLSAAFGAGDLITTGADSRDVLGIRNESRDSYVIESVQLDFANQQTVIKARR